MYIPRDTDRQTQPLHKFNRNKYTAAPTPKETAFDKVSFSRKRVKVNRPLQKIRYVADPKIRYAFLRSYWFWYAASIILTIIIGLLGA